MLNNFYKNACNYCLPKHTQLKYYDSFSSKKKFTAFRDSFCQKYFCVRNHKAILIFKYVVLQLFR